MSYYDNVKDNVKKQAAGNSSGSSKSSSTSESSSIGGNFDTLKEAASETEPDEEKGDDTPIEVLEEDGLSENPKRKKEKKSSSSKQNNSSSGSSDGGSGNPFKDENDSSSSGEGVGSADLSSVEDKLDTIIKQNQQLIEILEGFAE